MPNITLWFIGLWQLCQNALQEWRKLGYVGSEGRLQTPIVHYIEGFIKQNWQRLVMNIQSTSGGIEPHGQLGSQLEIIQSLHPADNLYQSNA